MLTRHNLPSLPLPSKCIVIQEGSKFGEDYRTALQKAAGVDVSEDGMALVQVTGTG